MTDAYLAISPRNMFNKTVSAISSALCPVATLSTFNIAAPRSRALKMSKEKEADSKSQIEEKEQ